MIKCNLCWCHRITNSWKGLGCKLRQGWNEEAQKTIMPCNVHENLMSIIMEKWMAKKKIKDSMDELANGFDVDANDIGKISKEIHDILREADDKMNLLIEKVQYRIMEMEEEHRKSVAEKAKKVASKEVSE